MTAQKHLKQLVRARMAQTGERYAAARRQIIREARPDPVDPAARSHLPGNIPATTALRVLLQHAAAPAPSEALLFGIAGGIGLGVFAFFYEREDVATFFIGGRRAWHDDLRYLSDALDLLGLQPAIYETGGAKAAERQLREALATHGPCIAWVDLAGLPHRAMPAAWSGGGYHVITVYAIDDAAGTALIGDLTDAPIHIPLAELAHARGRIKKQQHRLLALSGARGAEGAGGREDTGTRTGTSRGAPTGDGGTRGQGIASQSPNLESPNSESSDLQPAIMAGLRRCHAELLEPLLTQAPANARLDALRTWAERMRGGRAKESWERTFRPGPNLWRGLCAIDTFIEHYGTGGGLCRPIFADFLGEASAALGRADLADLAERYAALGRAWSGLAEAALPEAVPLLRDARALHARKAELHHGGAPAEEVRATWAQLAELERQAAEQFPLAEAACAELRAELSRQIMAIHAAEVAAHAALGAAIGR